MVVGCVVVMSDECDRRCFAVVDNEPVLYSIGRSGGGKSTITHLLMRFYDPKGGRITVDGKDLRDLNPIAYRRHLGIVAQVRPQ